MGKEGVELESIEPSQCLEQIYTSGHN